MRLPVGASDLGRPLTYRQPRPPRLPLLSLPRDLQRHDENSSVLAMELKHPTRHRHRHPNPGARGSQLPHERVEPFPADCPATDTPQPGATPRSPAPTADTTPELSRNSAAASAVRPGLTPSSASAQRRHAGVRPCLRRKAPDSIAASVVRGELWEPTFRALDLPWVPDRLADQHSGRGGLPGGGRTRVGGRAGGAPHPMVAA